MRRAWPNDSYRKNFQNIAMVGYILVYLQNITSIDAESGSSCDTTALRPPLAGEDLTVAHQTPSGPLARAPCTDALFSHLLSFFGVACKYRPPPLSALDATLMFARPPSALSMRMYSTFAFRRATGLIRTTNASKEQAPANRTIFSPPFRHKKAYITNIGEIDALEISFAGNEDERIKQSAPSPVRRGGSMC